MKGFINPHNKLSINLNEKVRNTQPTLRTISKWREEWIAKGYDKTSTFQSYKKLKCKQWHIDRKKRINSR